MKRRLAAGPLRVVALLVAAWLAAQLVLAAAQIRRQHAEERRLTPVAQALDSLESLVRENDRWLEANARLVQQYGEPERYARRVRDRAMWATAHRALTDAYNRRLLEAARRPAWLVLPTPPPRLRPHLPPPPGG